jgi:hypothetical protein
MAKAIQAFEDRSGKFHETGEAATLADIVAALGEMAGWPMASPGRSSTSARSWRQSLPSMTQ